MIIEKKVIREGYEGVVDALENAINTIEDAKAEEIALVEQKYADRLNGYKDDLARYVHIETEEVADEEPIYDENSVVEEEPIVEG